MEDSITSPPPPYNPASAGEERALQTSEGERVFAISASAVHDVQTDQIICSIDQAAKDGNCVVVTSAENEAVTEVATIKFHSMRHSKIDYSVSHPSVSTRKPDFHQITSVPDAQGKPRYAFEPILLPPSSDKNADSKIAKWYWKLSDNVTATLVDGLVNGKTWARLEGNKLILDHVMAGNSEKSDGHVLQGLSQEDMEIVVTAIAVLANAKRVGEWMVGADEEVSGSKGVRAWKNAEAIGGTAVGAAMFIT